jgi:hypothetical protein
MLTLDPNETKKILANGKLVLLRIRKLNVRNNVVANPREVARTMRSE